MGRDLTPIELELSKKNGNDGQGINIQNILPTVDGKEVNFCPELEPTMIPLKTSIVRIYHACNTRCQLWDATKSDCKLAR